MTSVGVRELKANLSRYLRLVQEQQTDVAVTAHGKTVARLVPASAGTPDLREALLPLAARGLLELPQAQRRRSARRPVVPKAGGKPLSAMVAEDRR